MRGLCGPHVNEETDLCRKTDRITFKMVSSQLPDTEIHAHIEENVSLSHTCYTTRFCFFFFSDGKNKCVCVWVKEQSHHTEHQSYLDEWFAQSFFVYFQHNVPDLFIRQAERAQENCCCDGKRRVISTPLFFLLDSGIQRDILELFAPQTKWQHP